jgi:hypothetical protein
VLPECWPSPTTCKCACLTWTRDRIPRSARDAIAQIKNELPYAWENIRVVVKNARLTLEGEVEWNYPGPSGSGGPPRAWGGGRHQRYRSQAAGGTRGTVRSWAERQEAEKAAWAAPGVARVDNRIIISP